MGGPALAQNDAHSMEMVAFGGVETTSVPQVARLYSKDNLTKVSAGHSRRTVAALYHRRQLWEHFAAHTPTCTLSLQRPLRVSNAVSYECVTNLSISQRGASGLDMLLAWMRFDRLKRSSATMLAWLCNVLPGDTSLHSLLLSARCTTQFDCGGSGCRNMFPERLVWQKATTAHH